MKVESTQQRIECQPHIIPVNATQTVQSAKQLVKLHHQRRRERKRQKTILHSLKPNQNQTCICCCTQARQSETKHRLHSLKPNQTQTQNQNQTQTHTQNKPKPNLHLLRLVGDRAPQTQQPALQIEKRGLGVDLGQKGGSAELGRSVRQLFLRAQK